MQKLATFVLMLCLTLSGVFSYAIGVAEQVNKKGNDGTPIEIIKNSSSTSSEKGNSIVATVNGHMLTVVFTENLGQVAVEVTTSLGTPVDCSSTNTPNGLQFYIPLAGDYIVTFTLPDGDEYYGEFTVTD